MDTYEGLTSSREPSRASIRAARQAYRENLEYSPFLKLPGEIRNRIYDYVFEPGHILNFDTVKRRVPHHFHPSRATLRLQGRALKYVCRGLRDETQMIEIQKSIVQFSKPRRFIYGVTALQRHNMRFIRIPLELEEVGEATILPLDKWTFRSLFPNAKKVFIEPIWMVRTRVETWKYVKSNCELLDKWFFAGGTEGLEVVCSLHHTWWVSRERHLNGIGLNMKFVVEVEEVSETSGESDGGWGW